MLSMIVQQIPNTSSTAVSWQHFMSRYTIIKQCMMPGNVQICIQDVGSLVFSVHNFILLVL